MNKNLKRYIYIIGVIVVILIIILIFISYSNKYYLKKLNTLLINNGYTTNEEISNCKSDYDCLTDSINNLDKSTSMLISAISQNNEDYLLFTKNLDEVKIQANRKNFKETYKRSEELIAKIESEKKVYIDKYSNDFTSIKKTLSDYGPINYYVIDRWAVVSVYKNDYDPANIILYKTNNWNLFKGPYTSYEWGQNKELENILNKKIHLIIDKPLLNYFNKPNYKEQISEIINKINVIDSEIKAIEELPYNGTQFDIKLEFINEYPNYIVTIYNKDDYEEIKKIADEWLRERNITTKTNKIFYNTETQAGYLE